VTLEAPVVLVHLRIVNQKSEIAVAVIATYAVAKLVPNYEKVHTGLAQEHVASAKNRKAHVVMENIHEDIWVDMDK
jgi:hypothetical protein